MLFEHLGLAPALLRAIKKAGFTEPTPVQQQAIPAALAGQDLIVTAQTGSGKTAAFTLPSLQKLLNHPVKRHVEEEKTESKRSRRHKPARTENFVQMLVLTPTRELALQVAEAAKTYTAGLKQLRVATVVGGMPYGAQIKALERPVDILVATPGRLLDHLKAKRINLSQIQTLVLDEADRMLDMGFIDDIETIVAHTSPERQTLMFSATFEGSVAKLAEEMLHNPQRISIADQKKKHDNIKQCLLYADDLGHKFRLLDYLLRDATLEQAIVFTATKRGADDLAERLADQGFAVAALHGDMNQRIRTRTLNALQKGKIQILVATDVAARGIDVQGITHAINYDLPMQPEDYVHRIGRTGRAGRNGLAFTLATHSERFKVRRIEQFIQQTIETSVIPGLEPTPKSTKKNSIKASAKDTSKSAKKTSVTRSKKTTDKLAASGKTHTKASSQSLQKMDDLMFAFEGDFAPVSTKEARHIKRAFNKEEQPKFADYERGVRSNKAKYAHKKSDTAETTKPNARKKFTSAKTTRATKTKAATNKKVSAKKSTRKKSTKRVWS